MISANGIWRGWTSFLALRGVILTFLEGTQKRPDISAFLLVTGFPNLPIVIGLAIAPAQSLPLERLLGVPLLLGASRKGLIRDVGQAPRAEDRMPGSVAVALAGVAQGVQILRIHDVGDTRQALRLWLAIEEGI